MDTSCWYIIINPTSGKGKALKKWRLIKKELLRRSITFQSVITEYHNHAKSLASDAVLSGYTKIVSVGGDGTLHQIVNGVLSSPCSELVKKKVRIGTIPIGTGNDWVKQYGITSDYITAIETLQQENTILQDIGKISSTSGISYFNNSAGIGFDGFVAKKVKQYKAFGSISYFLAAIIGIFRFKRETIDFHINSAQYKQKSLVLIIGICRYSGGGMQLTKDANPTDGQFAISHISNISIVDLLLNVSNLFNGKLAKQRFVRTFICKTLAIQCDPDSKFTIQADGELIDTGSFKVTLLPKALQFIIPY